MRSNVSIMLMGAALALSLATPAMADEWRATKLRGVVLELVDNEWRQLERGDVVPDERVVRTLRTGRVTFQRGNETIELGGQTQVQIYDRGGKPFTTVKQYFGEVGVEADVRQVEHFSVQTPFLSAVVKGTRFTVTSDKQGAEVDVERGHVAVKDRDSGQSTTVSAGQSASSGQGTPLLVSGSGELPAVVDAKGRVVTPTTDAPGPRAGSKAAAAEAYQQALAGGASEKEARQAAKAAEKAEKAAERSERRESQGSVGGGSSGGNSGRGQSGEHSGSSESHSSGNSGSEGGSFSSSNPNAGSGNSGNGGSGSSGNSGSSVSSGERGKSGKAKD